MPFKIVSAPRWLVVAAASLLLGLGMLAVVLYQAIQTERSETCEFQVQMRDENRAMWEYLIETNPDSPQTSAFVVAFEERLPKLECRGSDPLPHPVGED